MGRILRSLFRFEPNIDVDVVGWCLSISSVLIGIAGALWLGLSLAGALVLIGVVFFAQVAALSSPATAWIAYGIGGLVFSVMPALLGIGLGAKIASDPGAVIGGLAGFALGFYLAFASYRKITNPPPVRNPYIDDDE